MKLSSDIANNFGGDDESFVAFIDILGFRNLVLMSASLKEFSVKYSSIFTPLESEIQNLGIRHVLFSDSLLLKVENRPKDEQLKSLIEFAQKLLIRSISSKLPIRGAISYGKILWEGDVIVGRPIIEAVEYESLQNWLGIILSPSCINYCYKDNKLFKYLLSNKLIVKYDNVPIKKSDKRLTAYAINILSHDINTNELLQSLETMCIYSCSIEAQIKYKETEKYINFLSKQS